MPKTFAFKSLQLASILAIVVASGHIEAQTKTKRTSTRASPAATSAPSEARQTPLSDTEEAKAAVKALRSMDATVTSGVNFRDYSIEVKDLTVALSALEDVLGRRQLETMHAQVVETLKPYQDAKDLWAYCISECDGDFKSSQYAGDFKVLDTYMEAYPAANAPVDKGGAITPFSSPKQRQLYWRAIQQAMWADGGVKNKALRASLIPE